MDIPEYKLSISTLTVMEHKGGEGLEWVSVGKGLKGQAGVICVLEGGRGVRVARMLCKRGGGRSRPGKVIDAV